jgi:hypothetical protein
MTAKVQPPQNIQKKIQNFEDNIIELPSPNWLRNVSHTPTPKQECTGKILPFPKKLEKSENLTQNFLQGM